MIILSEVSQRKTNIIWYYLYVESKKNDTNELIYKTKINSHRKHKLMVTEGDSGVGEDKLGVWD